MSVCHVGIGARWSTAHVYPGDLLECPACKAKIVLANDVPVYDPDMSIETIQMN